MRLRTDEQELRVLWSIRDWKQVIFATSTLKETCFDPKVISSRWTVFIKLLKREHFPDLSSIRVIQEHQKGHGFHVHALIDRFLPWQIVNALAERSGLGRTNLEMVKKKTRKNVVAYVVRYLSRDIKHRGKNKALKGVRLLTASGSKADQRWWKRLSDLTIRDSSQEFRRELQKRIETTRFGELVLKTRNGRPIPIATLDLLKVATLEDIEWAKARVAEIVSSWE